MTYRMSPITPKNLSFLGGLALFCILVAPITVNQALAQCELSCENTDDDIQDVIEQMADLGYGLATGHFEHYNPENSDPVVDLPFAQPAFGVDYFISVFDDGSYYTRIGGQDTIVFRGCTPPGLGELNSQYCRADNIHFQSYNTKILEQNAENIPTLFGNLNASVGDPQQLRYINTESNDNSLFPAPYDRKTNVVFTGDYQTWIDVENAFRNADLLTSNSINLVGIPDDWFEYSESELDTPRDAITLVYTLDRDESEGCLASVCNKEVYLNQSFPFYIFYRDEVDPRIPLPLSLSNAGAPGQQGKEDKKAKREFDQLVKKFDQLVHGVEKYFLETHGMTLVADLPFTADSSTLDGTTTVGIFDHGYTCIENATDCQFDSPLTHYWWDRNFHTLGSDDHFVVVGIDHTELGATEYNKLGVYLEEDTDLKPFVPIDVVDVLKVRQEFGFIDFNVGKPLVPIRDSAFIYQIGRSGNCVDGVAGVCVDASALPDSETFMFRGDLTLNPETGTRPDPDQLVSWRLLHFKVNP